MADYVSRAFLLEGMDLSIVAAKAMAGDDLVALKAVDIMQTLRDFVSEAPAARVVPVVQALWKVGYTDKESKRIGVECSECGAFFDLDLFDFGLCYNCCPSCGARTDGGGGDG